MSQGRESTFWNMLRSLGGGGVRESKHILWEELKSLSMAAAQNVMQTMVRGVRGSAENVL